MESHQIVELLVKGTGPKELLARWKAFREEMAALQKERDAYPKARLEEIATTRDKIWAARRELRDANLKKIVAEKTTACQEGMEADAEKIEPHSKMMQSVA